MSLLAPVGLRTPRYSIALNGSCTSRPIPRCTYSISLTSSCSCRSTPRFAYNKLKGWVEEGCFTIIEKCIQLWFSTMLVNKHCSTPVYSVVQKIFIIKAISEPKSDLIQHQFVFYCDWIMLYILSTTYIPVVASSHPFFLATQIAGPYHIQSNYSATLTIAPFLQFNSAFAPIES